MSTGRPTILQIIPRLDAGGAELSAIEITDAIVGGGGRAIVLTEGGRMADRVNAAGGELIAFPAGTKNPARMMANAQAIRAMITREGIDLVHARSRAPAWSALAAARCGRVPFVTTYHGAYNETGPLKRLYNGVMARGDIVIANSGFTRELIRARYGTDAARLVVIHRGLDERAFDPDQVADDRSQALRTAWEVPMDAPVILLAARLTKWKGQDVLIDAMAELKGANLLGNAVAILAGDAQGRRDYVDALRRKIADRGLDTAVRIVGHVADIPAAFKTAQVAVVASTEPEAFGRSATESQAMCCPVIATRIGAPPETVLAEPETHPSQITGWLVPPGDPRQLAAELQQALNLTRQSRHDMGRRARRHVMSRFTLNAMKQSTLEVYDRLLGSRLAATRLSTVATVTVQ